MSFIENIVKIDNGICLKFCLFQPILINYISFHCPNQNEANDNVTNFQCGINAEIWVFEHFCALPLVEKKMCPVNNKGVIVAKIILLGALIHIEKKLNRFQ